MSNDGMSSDARFCRLQKNCCANEHTEAHFIGNRLKEVVGYIEITE